MNNSLLRILLGIFLLFTVSCINPSKKTIDFTTLFEKSQGTETPEYKDIITQSAS